MATAVSLVARNESKVVLLCTDPAYFLDFNFVGIGKRFAPQRWYSSNVVEIVQNTAIDLTVNLVKPDGTPFDLTGATGITLGIYRTKPIAANISLTSGSVTGAATDGILLFALSAADTDFDGFAEGSVRLTKNGKPVGFDSFQVVYRRDLFA